MDRDGTINEEIGPIQRLDLMRPLPGAADALKRLGEAGYRRIVVSNQARVARGDATEALVEAVHQRLLQLLQADGGQTDGFYYCPHHPREGRFPYRRDCLCRKPAPGLIQQAAYEQQVDMGRSYVVGDKVSDMLLADRLGLPSVLVLTGLWAAVVGTPSRGGRSNARPYGTRSAGGRHVDCARTQREMSAPSWNDSVPMNEVQRILIVKPSSLGDVVNALPFLSALRQRYPDRHIAWLVEEEAAELLLGHPLLDRVIVSGRRRWRRAIRSPFRGSRTLREIAVLIAELRQGRYDLVVDLQGLLKSALMVICAGARFRVGLAGSREGSGRAFTHIVPLPPGPLHAVDRYLEAARFLGAEPLTKTFVFPSHPGDELRADALLAEAGVGLDTLIVALHPQARWQTKLWGEEQFARVGEELTRRYGARILIIGSSSDLPVVRRLESRMNPAPFVAAGRTDLTVLIALFRRIDLLVTVDSGPMHLAAALETPLVALFGPTDPRLIGPYGSDGAVLRVPLPCSPCSKRRCRIEVDRLCMHSISVEQVVEAASVRLATGSVRRAGCDHS